MKKIKVNNTFFAKVRIQMSFTWNKQEKYRIEQISPLMTFYREVIIFMTSSTLGASGWPAMA